MKNDVECADPDPAVAHDTATIEVPDIRDYQLINAEVVALLDGGARRIRLKGVEGQRLLISDITGNWTATIEVEGNAGPELAAGLAAPNLKVVCTGNVADGAGSGMLGGTLLILGDAGACVGARQRSGCIIVKGNAAPRAGLNMQGGELILLGRVGRLAGERQHGGLIVAYDRLLGAHASRARQGGTFLQLGALGALATPVN